MSSNSDQKLISKETEGIFKSTFQNGSKNFYFASKLFSPSIRIEISRLYAFVRVVDDFVDVLPQQKEKFFSFKSKYYTVLHGGVDQISAVSIEEVSTKNLHIISSFVELQKKYHFEQSWVDAFFESMHSDLYKQTYNTWEETFSYIYGSAEVVGLMISKMLGVSEQYFSYAAELGKSFQLINMIRDIKADLELGRVYFPKEELHKFKFDTLSINVARQHPENFSKFIEAQIDLYFSIRAQSEPGIKILPKEAKSAVELACTIYDHIAQSIKQKPLEVLVRKVSYNRISLLPIFIKKILTF